ncbi:CCA tRNA nucleotidyltransferase [Halobacillus andaensis]|uniref:CCA tRNA nucleotidyltransferase n=1 Tax=Halobacillus andaensis TaxID=1176239 RepID=UPI003D726FFE
MNTKIDKALEVVKFIENAGGTAHIVGGAVRDSLLNIPVGDVDIASSLTPQEIIDLFPKVIPVGIEHGTVIVRYSSESYEVTTYRTEEGYEDFRHPDQVEFVRTIEEDLARRDFTINAMAMDQKKDIIDPYGGQVDLKKGLVRAVGKAEERFREDPLRIMRALRFASQLGFTLDSPTFKAAGEQACLLEKISVERLAVEFEKLCMGRNFQENLVTIQTLKVHHYLPIFNHYPSLIEIMPMSKLSGFSEIISFYLEKGPFSLAITDWTKDWKLSNRVRRNASILSTALQSYKEDPLPVVLYSLPECLLQSFINVLQAAGQRVDASAIYKAYQTLPIHSRKELSIQAKDLIHMFPERKKGPWIGEYLSDIERAVVSAVIPNENKAIKEWIKKWNPPETD